MALNRKTGVMFPAARGLRAWKQAVAGYAIQALSTTDVRFVAGEALAVGLTFTYERPGAHFRKIKGGRILSATAPTMKTSTPDIDKLVRAVLDGLVLGGAMPDDRQIVSLQAEKCWGTDSYVDVIIRAPRWAT